MWAQMPTCLPVRRALMRPGKAGHSPGYCALCCCVAQREAIGSPLMRSATGG